METEEERQARRRMRIEEMRREKRRVELLRKCIGIGIAILAGFGGCFLGARGAALLNYASAQEGKMFQDEQGGRQLQDGQEGREFQDGEPYSEGNQLAEAELSLDGKSSPGKRETAEGRILSGRNVTANGNAFMAQNASGDGNMSDSGAVFDGNAVFDRDAASGGNATFDSDVVSDGSAVLDGNAVFDRDAASDGNAVSGGDIVPDTETVSANGLTPEGEAVSTLGAAEGYQPLFAAHSTADTADFDSNITSLYGVMINVDDGIILAGKDAMERMNPASMTKIMTVLVAAEHLREEELDETVTITIDITDYCYLNDCSVTGYGLGETITIRDLFYGTILPSGADSALALAVYVAGSQEAFVELMNEKLDEMGLAGTTHFTNCVGLYNEDHYSTAYDIAMILKAAVDNEFCRDVLSMHIYTTSSTEQHPEGLRVSNMFLRRIEDVDTHGEVLCAKTGYVGQSGNCAASFSLGNDGREYLCVTAGASSSKNCIADQAELYRTFIPE